MGRGVWESELGVWVRSGVARCVVWRGVQRGSWGRSSSSIAAGAGRSRKEITADGAGGRAWMGWMAL